MGPIYRTIFMIFMIFVVTDIIPSSAKTAKAIRFALIIGNQNYEYATKLSNPVNDAVLIDTTLKNEGVRTFLYKDLKLTEFKKALRDFLYQLAIHGRESEGIIYFAGHGLQFNGRNFLVPTDANLKIKSDIPLYTIELRTLIEAITSTGAKSSIVMVDACRSNPFRLFRGAQGLRAEGAPPGVLVSFSTSPNNVAYDGDTENSPFAAAFSRFVKTPGMHIETVLKRVRYSVWKATNGAQIPWENTSLFDDFILVKGNPSLNSVTSTQGINSIIDEGKSILVSIGSKGIPKTYPIGLGSKSMFRDCPKCPEMVLLPKGNFNMGSDVDKASSPIHEVSVIRPFAISTSEVSFAEYGLCSSCTPQPDDEGWGKGSRPVINVSWQDAVKYTQWLSSVTGKLYRLPSEAEWEFAASGGKKSNFWFGDRVTPEQANIDFQTISSRQQTISVKTLPVNKWGLYHVHGNVSEWTADCWFVDYAKKPISIKVNAGAWTRPGCYSRVVRGGSWASSAKRSMTASRQWRALDERSFEIGFRVVRELSK